MKNKNEKRICGKLAIAMTVVSLLTMSASAAGFDDVARPIVELLDSLMTPILAIVGAAGSLYCILLGVKYAKAEEPQDREKAKSHLKNAIIGFVLIFVLILTLKLLMPVMTEWVSTNGAAA